MLGMRSPEASVTGKGQASRIVVDESREVRGI